MMAACRLKRFAGAAIHTKNASSGLGGAALGGEPGREAVLAGRVLGEAVGGEATDGGIVAVGAALEDEDQHRRGEDGADELRHDIAGQLLPGEAPTDGETDAHRRVQVTAGD